jgi:hypothetical protein
VEKITNGTAINPNVYNGAERPATDTENFFTEEKVSAVMRDLKDKSSYGPDSC